MAAKSIGQSTAPVHAIGVLVRQPPMLIANRLARRSAVQQEPMESVQGSPSKRTNLRLLRELAC